MARSLVHRRELLEGLTVFDRGSVEVPGTASAWVDEHGSAPEPEYRRQTLPIQVMGIPLPVGRKHVRYAGPFLDGLVVVEHTAPEGAVALLLERLAGPTHPKHASWRFCRLSHPPGPAWVRADGHSVAVRQDTFHDDPMYDEALRGEDERYPMRPIGS